MPNNTSYIEWRLAKQREYGEWLRSDAWGCGYKFNGRFCMLPNRHGIVHTLEARA